MYSLFVFLFSSLSSLRVLRVLCGSSSLSSGRLDHRVWRAGDVPTRAQDAHGQRRTHEAREQRQRRRADDATASPTGPAGRRCSNAPRPSHISAARPAWWPTASACAPGTSPPAAGAGATASSTTAYRSAMLCRKTGWTGPSTPTSAWSRGAMNTPWAAKSTCCQIFPPQRFKPCSESNSLRI